MSASRGLLLIQRCGQRTGKPSGGLDHVPTLSIFLSVAEALVKGQR